jgi:hypothetical protein
MQNLSIQNHGNERFRLKTNEENFSATIGGK